MPRFSGIYRLLPIGTLCLAVLTACQGDRTALAPVTDAWHKPAAIKGCHTIVAGETLYAVAWRYGYDYREIAKSNHLTAPYALQVGQCLHLEHQPVQSTPPAPLPTLPAAKEPKPTPAVPSRERSSPQLKTPKRWFWPVKGRILQRFSARSKGIDIRGRLGQPVRAAAAGRVVYSGNGLPGYGNLLIIKHSDDYLSAYGYNQRVRVHMGEWIKARQIIADMGRRETGGVARVHFEIRRKGRPINPLHYLKRTK